MPTKGKNKAKQKVSSSSNSPTPTASLPSSPVISTATSSPPPVLNTAAISVETLKDKGNKAFSAENYQKALELYTQGLEEANKYNSSLPSSDSIPPSSSSSLIPTHPLYSNRSATHLALHSYSLALADAEQCITLQPQWAKGYLRKGRALEQLLRYSDAVAAYQQGLALESADAILKKASDELHLLLSELKISETELSTHPNPEQDRFHHLVTWLRNGGAQFPKLYLQYYSEDYRGVHCLTKVPPEDTILFVPHSHMMTSQVAMDSPIGRKIIESKIDLRSKHSYLASYLLTEREKGPSSFWYPYIHCLPTHYSNMPLFFNPSLLAMLKGSFTLGKIQDRIDSLRAEYENIRAAVPEFTRFTHDEFVWARLVVITRIFGVVIHGTKTDGLVPYADMLNHKRPRDTSDTDTKWTFDDSLNGFTIISLKTIQRGEQVYDSYGRKCNSRFFVNYGFALDDNEEDNEVMLHFTLPANDSHYHMKLRILQAHSKNSNIHSLTHREFQVPATYRETSDREKKTKEMFSWLRFICAIDSELLLLGAAIDAHNANGNNDKMNIQDIEPISIRNESAVLKLIERAVLNQINEFDTTLEEDNEILNNNTYPLYSNERNCIVMRRGEKQVLDWYKRLSETCISLLSKEWREVKRLTAKSFQSNSPQDHYISTIIVPLVKRGAS